MATIKIQGGKVITKDGKVSCSCCEKPECCMYPAQALADGLYTAADLPDAVTVDGVSYSRSGSSYGNTVNGVIFETNVWAKYRNGSRSSRPCLIQSGVEVQFADTYTVASCSYAPVIGASVTRVSLCVWQGTYLDPENPYADGPQNVLLIYCPGTFIGCGAGEIFENGSGVEVPYFYATIDIGGSGGFYSKKTPLSNTPAGSYSGEFSISFS